jgi:KUP system potassium uptake protein
MQNQDPDPDTEPPGPSPRSPRELGALSLAALGVVYGDIGTSPLYAMRECVSGAHGVPPTPENVLGILALVTWALILVVTLKYLFFIMRADNDGEGGILALYALIMPRRETVSGSATALLLLLGLFGAGLLYGDGVITPVISILGAMEGLEVRVPAFAPWVVPITGGILISLFLVQRNGTRRIGGVFGWVMLVWFATIAAVGVPAILRQPEVLAAVNPWLAVNFFIEHRVQGFVLLGSVVLVITGAEALYADMGHLGRRPIQLAWLYVVLPALLLNYYGQGASILSDASAAENPFWALTPGWTLYPMLALATAAAVIASQALISGVFSLTRQAVQLGYWPRVRVVHTSEREEGQVYIPDVNYLMMAACIALLLMFPSSSALAAAYGIAVTGTMIITSLLFFVVARRRFGWGLAKGLAIVGAFLVVDVAFFSANAGKLFAGGWVPLVIGAFVFAVMTTWQRGRRELAAAIAKQSLPLELFLADVAATRPIRVPGTAVFMTSNQGGAPVVLLHHFKHNKVLHARVVLLSVVSEHVPKVKREEMVKVTNLGHGFWLVIAHVGFMQEPNVPALLYQCRSDGLHFEPLETSYYLGRESLLTTGRAPLSRWRKILFAYLSRNARPATQFFHLPPNRVVELGAQIEL